MIDLLLLDSEFLPFPPAVLRVVRVFRVGRILRLVKVVPQHRIFRTYSLEFRRLVQRNHIYSFYVTGVESTSVIIIFFYYNQNGL